MSSSGSDSTTQSMLRPGDQIAGYEIDDVLGMGGMAIVYRARQVSLDRPVALKVLSGQLGRDAEFRARFRREGILAATLEHPHIVPVYEAGEADGQAFIAMRLVDGYTLADRILARSITGADALEILTDVGRALDDAHAVGLVHRDVKPQNILIARSGHAYLTDFGVAKGGSEALGLTQTGQFLGSVNYASPEQIRGEPLTSRSDTYSMAVVLFQTLTGRVPFPRDTDAGTIHAHLSEPPPRIRELCGDVAPTELDEILAQGLAKTPEMRTSSVAALLIGAAQAIQLHAPGRLSSAPSFPPLRPTGSGAPCRQVLEAEVVARPGPGVDRLELAAKAEPGRVVTAPVAHDATTVERPRTTKVSGTAPTAGRTTPVPARAIAGAGVLAAVVAMAAIAGALAGSGGTDEAKARPLLTSDGISVPIPSGWSAPTAATAGDGVETGVVSLDPQHPEARLVVGALPAADTPRDPLRAPLRPAGAQPRPASLGDTPLLVYRGANMARQLVDARVLLTTRGPRAIACRVPAGLPGSRDACQAVLNRLRTERVSVSSPVPDAALAKSLSGAVTSVASSRTSAAARLRARDLSKRAAAVTTLATADRAAAKRIAAGDIPAPDSAKVASVVTALRDEATTLSALAAAARQRDRRLYDARREAVHRANARVRRALLHLQDNGYSVSRTGLSGP